MSSIQVVEKKIKPSNDVDVKIDGNAVEVKGPLGTLKEDLSYMPVEILFNQEEIVVRAYWPRKKVAALVGTAASHIKNMITGVTKGFTYKLKIVYAHFPMNVKVDETKRNVIIENFMGERSPRITKIEGNVDVKVSGDEIIIKGIDLGEVSQTAANIENATKIKKKDQRVFLDGIYVYIKEKA